MKLSTFLKPLSFIPAILLMYMIFSFSSQSGEVSSSVSFKVSCVLVETADRVFDMGLDDYQIPYYAEKIHGVTRKLAHMTEYFLLAISVSFPLYVYGLRGILLLILAGGLCVAFACGDEYHQSFVSGRSPSQRDVMIDSVGIILGVILVRIIGWTGRMTIFRPFTKKSEEARQAKKEQKRLDKQMRRQQKHSSGYPEQDFQGSDFQNASPDGYYRKHSPYQNGPYRNDLPYQNEPYRNDAPYQNGPYRNDAPYQNGPYRNDAPYQNGPYRNDAPYQNGPYRNDVPYQNGPYRNDAPYQNGPYRNDAPYQNESYRNDAPYQNGPYRNDVPYQNGSYQNNTPYQNGCYGNSSPKQPYYGEQYEDPDWEETSDELSDDMPLSHLFHNKQSGPKR